MVIVFSISFTGVLDLSDSLLLRLTGETGVADFPLLVLRVTIILSVSSMLSFADVLDFSETLLLRLTAVELSLCAAVETKLSELNFRPTNIV